MEEDFGQEKTEPATPRRREEARRQGQVAVSEDLTSGVLLLAGVIALWLLGQGISSSLLRTVRYHLYDLLPFCGGDFGFEKVLMLSWVLLRQWLEVLGPLFVWLFLVNVGIGLLQVGIYPNFELLSAKWEKLSPAEGFKRLFSVRALVRALLSFLRVGVLAAIAYWTLRSASTRIAELSDLALPVAASQAWDVLVSLALWLASAMAILGVIDYIYQRFRFERSLRMTRQELKEELKREEGDPLYKARLRRMQREAAQRRMLQEVPKATVVVTNPGHLAVALRYDHGKMPAPRVVAKGEGMIAQRIIEMARKNNVPVMERRTLARALYQSVPVDELIPSAMFYVVAELLAQLYRSRGIGTMPSRSLQATA
ncbi:MAG: flagellar biosynthetic protein FlhB [Gemmatales bacterium]|nr:MAG: flagellar biosynthetic protein FlhB [Gemmatales bacterium]